MKTYKRWIVLASGVAVLASATPLLVALHLTNRMALQQAQDEASDLALRALRRNEQITDQVYASLRELEAQHRADPCDEASLAFMRRTALHHSRLQAVGFVRDGRLLCSSLGLHGTGIDLGPADFVSSNGLAVRTERTLPFGTDSRYRISTWPSTGYTAFVHTDNAVDVVDASHLLGVGLVATATRKPISKVGVWQPDWAQRLGAQTAVSFVDGEAIVGLRHSERYQYFTYAAVPISQVEAAWQGPALLLMPLGLGAGLLIAAIVLWAARQQMGMPAQLQQALQRDDELHLAYQPIVRLDTGQWAGAEALLRWTRRDGEAISPDVFIDVAERHGLIGDVTAKVLQLVARDAGPLLRDHPGFFVSVNVAASDLTGERLPTLLADTVRQLGVPPATLRLEATERTFIDADVAQRGIARLRDMGHPIAIDDFGTGYSNLSYLATLRVDALKIDKSFVCTIGTDAATSQVVPHIIEMAKSLQLRMVAEGVETPQQAEYLRERGVSHAQGWLFARAMDIDALGAGLRDASRSTTA